MQARCICGLPEGFNYRRPRIARIIADKRLEVMDEIW
jgi:hypothetical protein